MISVPCLMTRATRQNLKPSKEETSFINLFKKLHFKTIWVSEQAKFSSINTSISSIAKEAEKTVFRDNNLKLKLNELKHYFHRELKSSQQEKLSIFHMLGSHFLMKNYIPVNYPIMPQLALTYSFRIVLMIC
jgi:glucan phosphoethanolaminetransferase (alkaline phosphatase superfamily)